MTELLSQICEDLEGLQTENSVPKWPANFIAEELQVQTFFPNWEALDYNWLEPMTMLDDVSMNCSKLHTIVEEQYGQLIEKGFQFLQKQFLEGLQRSRLHNFYIHSEIKQMEELLLGQNKNLGNAIELSIGSIPACIVMNLRRDAHLVKLGRQREIVLQKTIEELLCENVPVYEAECFIKYYEWLQDGKFHRSMAKSTTSIAPIPLTWLGTNTQLQEVWRFLKMQAFIDEDLTFEGFHHHFKEQDFQPIHWQEANNLLIYLFEQLIEHKFLPSHYRQNIHQLITQHFLSKNREKFKRASLAVAKSKGAQKARKAYLIDDLMLKLKRKQAGKPLTH